MGASRIIPQALYWLRRSADRGNANAQLALAKMYEHGLGVPQFHQQATNLYLKAAEQGLVEAYDRLACMCLHGLGIAEDVQQALLWFRKAADAGHADAQYQQKCLLELNLVDHEEDDGSEPDNSGSSAASPGPRPAEVAPRHRRHGRKLFPGTRWLPSRIMSKRIDMLSMLYEQGRGVDANANQSLQWVRKAAEQGHTGSAAPSLPL